MKPDDLNARDVAVEALRDRAGNTSAHLARLLGAGSLPQPERALARELALGVTRRKQTLLTVIRKFLAQPDRRLPSPIEEILMVGLYQILFTQRVPDFAAVSEAVNQAIRFAHKRQSGLVNGLLRGVTRSLSEPLAGPPPLASDILPVGPDSYRRIDRPVFADPSSEPAEYLAEAFSLPLVLSQRWLDQLGGLAKTLPPATQANVRAPMILRVNRLRATVDQVLISLAEDGAEACPHDNGVSVALGRGVQLSNLEVFRSGWVQVQDPTATAIVAAARPGPDMKVLDFCAAPGTKTTHLAELMDNRGEITAIDVSQDKLDKIESNCKRMGISIVTTVPSSLAGGLTPDSFDLALVDAPCSNTGVLARRAEARWRFDPQKLEHLARDQRMLVQAAATFVRPGGRLIYSTCSIEPEECSQVAKIISRPGRGLRLVRQELILPGGASQPEAWHDGGYYAILEVR